MSAFRKTRKPSGKPSSKPQSKPQGKINVPPANAPKPRPFTVSDATRGRKFALKKPTVSQTAVRSARHEVGSALPFSAHRSLTASAQILDVSTSEARSRYQKRRASAQGWQDEAWAYFDAIGEVKYALYLVANVLSRVKLYAGVVNDPRLVPSPVDTETPAGAAAANTLARLDSAFGGQPGLLRDAALNLSVTGEFNLVQQPANRFTSPPTPETWDVRSTDELQLDASGNVVIYPTVDQDKNDAIVLPKNAFIARIWRPHPRFSQEADSSMRSILDACAELMLLNKTFRSTARSRLNSGLLYLPDGLSVSAAPDPGEFVTQEDVELDPDDPDFDPSLLAEYEPAAQAIAAEQSDTDDFEEALIEAMTTPIADEESASAVVPLLVRGPADLGEKIKLIKFERAFDPALAERAQRVLDRVLQGLDVPKEIVAGVADVKYSNAQVIDEQLYSTHIEPLALLICDALTTVFLRPALRAQSFTEDEVRKYVIWYDASDVTTRPNRADDAQQGLDNYAVSWDTWRRAHNFTDDDAPTPNEVAIRMLIDSAQMTPELTEALLSVVSPDIMGKVREATQANSPAPLPEEVVEALSPDEPAGNTELPTTPEEPEEPGTPAAPAEPSTPAETSQPVQNNRGTAPNPFPLPFE